MTETFTDSLRQRLLEASKFCPTCGQPTVPGGLRALSARTGVGTTVLWKFLKGGNVTSPTIDAIVEFLGGPV